jgi:pSer/pThr/pTyr-binding forkhead associated (FHA) protein
MELEIGVVCARCDRYAPMGIASCAECGTPLALLTRGAEEPLTSRDLPLVAPARAAESGDARRVTPPGVIHIDAAESASETLVARAGYTDPPPNSILRIGALVPRRGAAGVAAVQGGRAVLAPSPESAVSSPGEKPRQAPPPQAPNPPSLDLQVLAAAAHLTLEELMDQAKNFVCRSCQTPVPVAHKFCGRCGAAVPPEILGARTQFFGQLQAPGKAKLILIRGEGVEGLSYQLNAEQHVVGRNGQLVFPDDPFVSPKHANLFYREGTLVVRDEGSQNGVFVRVKGTVEAAPGDQFLAGEQLFKLDANPKANDGPAPDGTYFYSSPKHQSLFRITQVLQGGNPGMVVCARGQSLQIGREGSDLNFPGDLYMSAGHCRIEELNGKFSLTDLNSRNGTYIRLKAERELAHGDYMFIGRKLLRVEITAA